MVIKELVRELQEYLLGLSIHGVSNLRKSDTEQLEKMSDSFNNLGMIGLCSQLEKFIKIAHRNMGSREKKFDNLMKEYFTLYAYVLILLEE